MIQDFIRIFLLIYFVGHPQDPMVDLVNTERFKAGVQPVSQNSKLVDSATAKACDMANRGYWAHLSPDGKTPWSFFNEASYRYRYAGENLCRDAGDVECMKLFMDSPRHRENILASLYNEIGIGRCGVFVVQHFGRK